jgi:hypothetical protein
MKLKLGPCKTAAIQTPSGMGAASNGDRHYAGERFSSMEVNPAAIGGTASSNG